MMFKRIAQLATVVAIGTLSFTACGGSTSPATSSVPSSTSAPTSAGSSATSPSAPASSGAGSVQISCPTGKVNGGGSSAQDLAMQSLATEYNQACSGKSQVIYTKSGSGQGIKDFYNKQLQWAGSDSALKSKAGSDGVVETEKVKTRCENNPGWNLPMIVGPVAFAYNIEGVSKLTLTPALIADIYNGKITTWNDPAIVKVNSGVTLPAQKIAPFYRNDESGTSENVSKYLKAAAPANFTAEPAKKFPAKAGEGKQGTQGVADAVKNTKGGFGYMEWKYAKDAQVTPALLDNGQGAVELTAASAGKAMEKAKLAGEGNDLAVKLQYTDLGAGVYPMVMVTYEIVCSAGLPADQGAVLKDFLTYVSSTTAQSKLEAQGYAPLPAAVQEKVAKAVSELK